MKHITILTGLLLSMLLTSAPAASAVALPPIVDDAATGLRILEGSPVHLPPVRTKPIVPPTVAGGIDDAERYGAASAAEASRLDGFRDRARDRVRSIVAEIDESTDFEELSTECVKNAFTSAAEAADQPPPGETTTLRQVFEGKLADCVAGVLENEGVPPPAAEEFGEGFAQYVADAVSGPVADAATEASGRLVWVNWLTETGNEVAQPGASGQDEPVEEVPAGPSSEPDPPVTDSDDSMSWEPLIAVVLGLLCLGGGVAWYRNSNN